ncbi:hypothetical protein CW713_09175 [Methanophagales archaeon]|nr:MAG: hypothetical protein CW714_06620 [Methanophagales archaeon]RJS78674.1 MAG: hypothetical protein CW713_09175 [Methanophagales archaeon]
MVLAGKLFLVEGDIDAGLPTIAAKLKGFKSEDKLKENDRDISLITEIKNLRLIGDSLHGTFIQDQLLEVYHHGERVHVPTTSEAPFFFVEQKQTGRIVLTIMEKKARANNIANQLSKILFITTGKIVEVRIEPSRFERFHEDNFEDTKVIFFDDVDLPNIKKLSLYGSALGNTSMYADHLKHGKIWYIVLKSKRHGTVVGVTRNGVVTIFSKAKKEDFINYVLDEIIDLI